MTTSAASRLVSLYPAAWRMRYGDEFAHVLTEQPLSLRLTIDVIAGAIDARLHGGNMTSLMTRCAAGGPQMTTQDAWRASSVMIGASLVFAGLYIWAKMNFANEDLVDAFGIMAYPAALIVAMPYYYMKDHSRAAKVTIVVGCLAILAGISYLTALI